MIFSFYDISPERYQNAKNYMIHRQIYELEHINMQLSSIIILLG